MRHLLTKASVYKCQFLYASIVRHCTIMQFANFNRACSTRSKIKASTLLLIVGGSPKFVFLWFFRRMSRKQRIWQLFLYDFFSRLCVRNIFQIIVHSFFYHPIYSSFPTGKAENQDLDFHYMGFSSLMPRTNDCHIGRP